MCNAENSWKKRALAAEAEAKRWKSRALLVEMFFGWNQKIKTGNPRPEMREKMEFSRSWYMHNRHMHAGTAAEEIHQQLQNLYPGPDEKIPGKETITDWIKDLAPPEVAGRGRPRKK
jgi:hypothetical protein